MKLMENRGTFAVSNIVCTEHNKLFSTEHNKLFVRSTINGLYYLAEEKSVAWGETKRSGNYFTLSCITEESYSGLNILSVYLSQ